VARTCVVWIVRRCVHATDVAEVARRRLPDAAEVEVEQFDGHVGDLLEFLPQCSSQEELCLEPIQAR